MTHARCKYSQIPVPDLKPGIFPLLATAQACFKWLLVNAIPITVQSLYYCVVWSGRTAGRSIKEVDGGSWCLMSPSGSANKPLDASHWDRHHGVVSLCLGSDDVSCVCKDRACVGREWKGQLDALFTLPFTLSLIFHILKFSCCDIRVRCMHVCVCACVCVLECGCVCLHVYMVYDYVWNTCWSK